MNAKPVFLAHCIFGGALNRIWVEAANEDTARKLCGATGFAFASIAGLPADASTPLPESYDEKTARQLLGGISRSTLYRELADGKLKRVSGTTRLLITRVSIEARKNWTAKRTARQANRR